VVGCTGAGLLTEREWVLDSPGAAALVFGEPAGLEPVLPRPEGGAGRIRRDATVLSFATPCHLDPERTTTGDRRIGAIASDLFGHGPFAVWSGARANPDGRVDVRVRGFDAASALAPGVRPLSRPAAVVRASGPELLRLGGQPALTSLVRSLPTELRQERRLPVNRLMCGITSGDPATAVREGRFRLDPLVGADTATRSITVATPLDPGQHVFWALRDRNAAEQDMDTAIDRAAEGLGAMPDFGLLFPCVSRGPAFYGHEDRDLDLLRGRFPGLPVVGFYGNGEIAPGPRGSHVHQYAAVVALFRRGAA